MVMAGRKKQNSRKGDIRSPVIPIILILLSFAAGCFLKGCLPMELRVSLTVMLPVLPDNLRGEITVDYFLITYFNSEGIESFFFCPPEYGSVELECLKQANIPVTIRPVIRCGEKGERLVALLPAGAIYPLDAEMKDQRIVLTPTWEDGFAADIFRKLYKQNVAVEKFNLKRFYYELGRLHLADLWLLDEDYTIEKIAGGSFRVTYLKEKQVFPVEIPVESGQWVTNNPFSQIYTADSTSGMLKINLTPGFHTLIELKKLNTVDIFIDKEGGFEYADFL